jgi:hypothetical protein
MPSQHLKSHPSGGSIRSSQACSSTASSMRNSQIFTPSIGDRAGSATPTSAFVSSLVSSVSATAPSSNADSSGLNNDDTRLLERLFQSLGIVCMDLQAITTSQDASVNADPKAARMLRRRLDAARRVLDGELDA